jgi:hypothetical protein
MSFGLTGPMPPHFENVVPGHYTLAVDGGLNRELDVREGGTTTVRLP